ncbi:MAG: hypothetical protein GXO99_03855 [Nitrospirae bacterium]|nr:hypothetical protein [Nitrospirota bacterium]
MDRASYPYQSVQLSSVVNMTSEPGLDQRFYEAFLSVCNEQGFNCIDGDVAISVKLTKFRLLTRSLKSSYSSEYSVVLNADVILNYPDGEEKRIDQLSSEFDESFIAQNTVEEINTNQELVTARALEELARRIIHYIIYKQTELDQKHGIKKAQ